MIILINAILIEYKFQENEFFDNKGEYLFGQQKNAAYSHNLSKSISKNSSMLIASPPTTNAILGENFSMKMGSPLLVVCKPLFTSIATISPSKNSQFSAEKFSNLRQKILNSPPENSQIYPERYL